MAKSTGRPEQLHLELKWDYLQWLTVQSEDYTDYERAARKLIDDLPVTGIAEVHPIWKELTRSTRNLI